MANNCCKDRKKHRDDAEYKKLMNRLSRIEGQVRGIKTMLENEAYCPDIMIQVAAVNAALQSFNKILLEDHIKTCVASDIASGKPEATEELIETLNKIMK